MSISTEQTIGEIGNYYGRLSVRTERGKFYWGIENYDGCDWEEIPESLYKTLVEYESARLNGKPAN